MSDKKFWVVGGEYADTAFTRIIEGKDLEKYGPFTEKQAHDTWRELTGRTVDNAMVRYFVRADEEMDDTGYFVVGGEYADTDFKAMAPGREVEVYGPFKRQQAMDFWRGITSQTVDSALHRYDITRVDPRD